MKKIRFYYWIIKSLLQRHLFVILGAAIVGAIFTTQIDTILTVIPKPKTTKYIGQVGNFTLATLPDEIQNLVSSGLTSIDSTGAYQLDLASDIQILDSGKTYIFEISESAYWHDGTKVKSQDFNYSFDDVTSQTPDDQTIIFKLTDSFVPFPNLVSQPIFKRTTKSFAGLWNNTSIIGTKEYTITDLKLSGNTILQLTLESPSEKKIYRFYKTESSAIIGFKLGEIDYLESLSSSYDLESWQYLDIQKTYNRNRLVAVYFNNQDPNLQEKSIRQALTYLIPNKPEDETRALGPISPNSWAYNPNIKPYIYSSETAKQLVENLNMNFDLELSTTPSFVSLADQIKTSWEQLGINVRIKIQNVPELNNYQALLIGQQIPQDPDQYLLWHSTQNSNITNYSSAKVDKLLEDGRKETDIKKRKVIYQEFQKFLVEDSPAAFLFYMPQISISR